MQCVCVSLAPFSFHLFIMLLGMVTIPVCFLFMFTMCVVDKCARFVGQVKFASYYAFYTIFCWPGQPDCVSLACYLCSPHFSLSAQYFTPLLNATFASVRERKKRVGAHYLFPRSLPTCLALVASNNNSGTIRQKDGRKIHHTDS